MHTMPKRIYYHDTDCGGVVYYANYLKYFEEARTEFMRERGVGIAELAANEGILFVVRNVLVDYKAPARYNDALTITTEITQTKNVSMVFFQKILRGEQLLVSAKTVLVCINKEFHPIVIPEDLITRFGGHRPSQAGAV